MGMTTYSIQIYTNWWKPRFGCKYHQIFVSSFFQQTHSHTRTPNFIICMFFWLVAHNMFHYWSGTDFSVCCAQVRQQQVQQLVQGHHRHGFPHQGGPDRRPRLHIAGLLPGRLQCCFRAWFWVFGSVSGVLSCHLNYIFIISCCIFSQSSVYVS